jgi:predicted nucleic acid-binding protein
MYALGVPTESCRDSARAPPPFEKGSDVALAVWNACDVAAAGHLAYPEVRAALAAAARDGRLDPDGLRRAEATWETCWTAMRFVGLTEELAVHAGRLVAEHALHGADAVHLASALAVGTNAVVLATWDQRLRAAAQAVELALAPAGGALCDAHDGQGAMFLRSSVS